MTPLTTIAGFVQSDDLAAVPTERLDRVKRHVADTWGARIAGSAVADGIAASELRGDNGDLFTTIVAGCAQARCTEVDDVHLASCTTPGSVVVPTALAIASARAASGDPSSVREFCAAVLAGYETLIRVGAAIDGPAALHRGMWPTAFAAAFGSAATAARLLRLTVPQTASALATALTFAQHCSTSSAPLRSSRWVSLGVAAASGVIAAQAARAGLAGIIDAPSWSGRLTRGLGRQYLFDAIGMKPYPTARQGLAAIEAAREIVRGERLDARDIDDIAVGLPEEQRVIVDRAGFPETRFASIVGVRYQIAVAIAAPDRLHDVRRTPPFDGPAVRATMRNVRVRRARDLDGVYPRSWPAAVTISVGRRRYTRVVRHPRGDARRPLDWEAVAEKLRAIAGPIAHAALVDRVLTEWRSASIDAPVPAFP